MDALSDRSWMKHLYDGTVKERFRHGEMDIVMVEAPKVPGNGDPCVYRMLAFPATVDHHAAGSAEEAPSTAAPSPVAAINFESTMLGGWAITEQRDGAHRVAARFDLPLSYEDFREAALGLLRHEDQERKRAGR